MIRMGFEVEVLVKRMGAEKLVVVVKEQEMVILRMRMSQVVKGVEELKLDEWFVCG